MVISTGELYEEISDLAAPRDRDAFEDEGKMQEAVFAELGLPLAFPTLPGKNKIIGFVHLLADQKCCGQDKGGQEKEGIIMLRAASSAT